MPKAKAAANKAVEIDDTLAEAHAELGSIIFWYDWDWNAAEKHIKRALELNPNSAETHLLYAAFLSNTGRYAEAIPEVRRAVELDPPNLGYKSLEGVWLIRAGRIDEGLAVLQKVIELEPNRLQPYLFAIRGYLEKGMFAEAVASARKARELAGISPQPIAFLGYTLAMSGKRAEAQTVLEELLKLSNERHVSPYDIATVYHGLDERDKTLEWLEKGYQQREPRMTLLKVERKWDNLRDDPRFHDLMRRVGLPQ
jgi:Flp pilus assembly protein TadD